MVCRGKSGLRDVCSHGDMRLGKLGKGRVGLIAELVGSSNRLITQEETDDAMRVMIMNNRQLTYLAATMRWLLREALLLVLAWPDMCCIVTE